MKIQIAKSPGGYAFNAVFEERFNSLSYGACAKNLVNLTHQCNQKIQAINTDTSQPVKLEREASLSFYGACLDYSNARSFGATKKLPMYSSSPTKNTTPTASRAQ